MPFESIGQKGVRERLEIIVKEGSHARASLMLSELKRTLETKEVFFSLHKGILKYIYAVGALAFACRDINIDSIVSLLLALNINPDHQMLETIKKLHYKNYNIHMNILYFMMAMGIEPTIDNVMELVRVMGFKYDPTLAGYTIEYFKEFNSGKVSYSIPELEGDLSTAFNKTADMIFSLSNIISDYVIKEIEDLMHDQRLTKFSESQILPYLSAIGLLSFSGRDLDRENIESVMNAMGTNPETEVLDAIGEIHFRNHIVYMAGLYFIRAVGMESSLDKLMSVVKSMDATADEYVAGNVITFYKTSMSPAAP
jgi:ribosomal protein L12E/L44/L45/RPP1/RPP2